MLTLHAMWAVPSAIVWGVYLAARWVRSRWIRYAVYVLDGLLALGALSIVWMLREAAKRPEHPDDHIGNLGWMGLDAYLVLIVVMLLASAIGSAWATYLLEDGSEPGWLEESEIGNP